eukprot:scaffold965_cov273-Ochromonas_danica.AAC.1
MWFAHACSTSSDASASLRMGIAELKRGNNSQAQRAFEQTVRSDATFAEAHNKLAALYQSDKRYSECIDEANEALKFMPHHYGARL